MHLYQRLTTTVLKRDDFQSIGGKKFIKVHTRRDARA